MRGRRGKGWRGRGGGGRGEGGEGRGEGARELTGGGGRGSSSYFTNTQPGVPLRQGDRSL